jgi:hypothetical protein
MKDVKNKISISNSFQNFIPSYIEPDKWPNCILVEKGINENVY